MAEQRHELRAEVLTPEGMVFEGDLFQISVRTVVGELGVRSRHSPVLARLVPAELRLYESESDYASSDGGERYAAAEGWLEVFGNRAHVLVGQAVRPDALDAGEQRSKLDDAEQRLADAEEGSAAYDAATLDRDRAEAFLKIAGG